MSAKKKQAKRARKNSSERKQAVEISYQTAASPERTRVFSHYAISVDESFLTLSLAYFRKPVWIPVFHCKMNAMDASDQVPSVADYFSRIGGPEKKSTAYHVDPDLLSLEAPYFATFLGFSVHGPTGELLIGSHSYKAAFDAIKAEEGKSVMGTVLGLFASSVDAHKALAYDFVKLFADKVDGK